MICPTSLGHQVAEVGLEARHTDSVQCSFLWIQTRLERQHLPPKHLPVRPRVSNPKP